MRIGVNCYILKADIGGIKQYFISLMQELLKNDNENEYVFFYFKHNIPELEKLGSGVLEKRGILLESQRQIKEYLHRIDLFFCPFGSLIPRPLPVPTVVTIVDIQEVFFPDFFTFHNLVARFWHYVGSTRMADHVITISNFSKETLIEHHHLSPDKVTVSHLCADERYYRSSQVAKRPDTNLPDQFIFYPANRWVHKNHDTLLRAMVWLRDRKKKTVHAVFTGFDQENGYAITQKAEEYGLATQVVQLSYVSVEELAYLYTHAACMVFPSFFEGFGIPVVEAMASGCPVIASNTTSLPEVGRDGVAYFDPASYEELAQTILMHLENPTLLDKLTQKGYERAGDFSPAKMADKHRISFCKASKAFSRKKYYYLRYVYKYIHALRTLIRAGVILARKTLRNV